MRSSPQRKILLLFFVAALTLVVPAPGQQGKGSGGGRGNRWGEEGDEPKYDPKTLVTVSGTIQEIGTHAGRLGTPRSRILIHTKTSGIEANIEANLGPSSFLEENRVTLEKGEAVTVTGSKVKHDGMEIVLVREIRSKTRTFLLRTEDGSPRWEARHR